MAKKSKNNKFHKILHLERGMIKKGFSKSANFAKIVIKSGMDPTICVTSSHQNKFFDET